VVEAGVTVRAAGLTRSLRPLTIGADEETNPPTEAPAEALDTT